MNTNFIIKRDEFIRQITLPIRRHMGADFNLYQSEIAADLVRLYDLCNKFQLFGILKNAIKAMEAASNKDSAIVLFGYYIKSMADRMEFLVNQNNFMNLKDEPVK